MTKNIQKFSKTQEENWKDLWRQPCPASEKTEKSRANRKLFWKRKETTSESTLLHWRTYAISTKCGVRTKITEEQRQSRAPWGHCKKDDSGAYAVFLPNWARLRPRSLPQKSWMLLQDYQVVMDMQLMQHLPTPRSNFGGCSIIALNSQVRVSRCFDTSSTTHMVKIMWETWRSCDTSWTKFVRSSFGRTVMGKAIRRSFIRTWMGENSELGMCVRSS